MADDGIAAEDGRSGVDGHVVFDGRVTLEDARRFAGAGSAERTERDALVNLHVAPDDARFSDDDAGAVIDEETLVDPGTCVDVDSRLRMRVLGQNARDHRYTLRVEDVCDAIRGDRANGRVTED